MHGWQPVNSIQAPNTRGSDRVTAWWQIGVKVASGDWQLECSAWIHYVHFYSSRNQPVNRQAHTNYTLKSTTPRRAALLGTYWHLTTTTLSKAKQRKQSWKWCMSICDYFLCVLLIAAHSGCSSILLQQLNACPLIYISNLATIKIPWLLVNSLSLPHGTPDLWQLCHVMQMLHLPTKICMRGNVGPVWSEHRELACEPRTGSSLTPN